MGRQGRSVSDMQFHGGELFESTLVGRSPENREDPVDLAEFESVPRLIHRYDGDTFVNDPFEPAPLVGVPADGTELLGLDASGTELWAVGGGAASGPSAPPEPRSREGRWRRDWSATSFEEVPLKASFGSTDRFGDVAVMPGTRRSDRDRRPLRRPPQRQQQGVVARIAGRRDDDSTRLPVAGSGRGSAARIACPAPTNAGW